MMHCGRCDNGIDKCQCPDIEERMADLVSKTDMFVFRVCMLCGKHYARCRCTFPDWTMNIDLIFQSRWLNAKH